MDTGSFKINPKPGEFTAGDRDLDKMTGDLIVIVNKSPGQEDPSFGEILITNATAKFSGAPQEHEDGEKHGKKKGHGDD